MSAKKNVRILRVCSQQQSIHSPHNFLSPPPPPLGCWQHNDKDTMQSFCFLQTVNLLTIGWSQELLTIINYASY